MMLRMARITTTLALGVVFVTAGCDNAATPEPVTAPGEVDLEKPSDKLQVAKADQWGSGDAPTIFDATVKTTLADLPLDGEATSIPWASSYWPVYRDSINMRWDGASSESASFKYGKAFGVADVETKVSKYHGIDAQTSRKACTKTADCNATIGEACALRTGATSGRCIPTWWGICHAWAPGSIMEAEPKHAVTRGGVTFKVNDIKALVTLAYNETSSRFVSLRCDKDNAASAIHFDAYGRPTEADRECRDTNAGTYHILLANYLGLRGQSFVEDRTFDDEVWNQPLRGFRFTQLKEVSVVEAHNLLGVTSAPGDVTTSTFDIAALAKGAWHHQPAYTVNGGTKVTVRMTGDHDGDLFVHLGAQPTEAVYTCRPYDNGSNESCEIDVPAGGTQSMFVSVNAYDGPVKASVTVSIPKAGAGVPTAYVFNTKAAKLYHVKAEVDYISESDPEVVDGNLSATIDTYTHTDRYDYILEVDATGKINGGEWIGSSKTGHPDFLWLPTGRKGSSVAGGAITWANVKSILDESVAPIGGGGSTSAAFSETTLTLAKGEWKTVGPFTDVQDAFSVVMTGTGDADLYVRKTSAPTTTAYDCRPYASGSAETCTGSGAGTFYISVYGYAAATAKVTVTYTKTGGTTTPPVTITHLNISASVTLNGFLTYTVDVKAGQKIVVKTTAPSDIDLYVRMNLAPTVNAYDQRGYTASGNETLTVVPTADGKLYVGVHGYAASSFTLVTADN